MEHIEKTVEHLQTKIKEIEAEAADKKRMVNDLCRLMGRDPIYEDTSPSAAGSIGTRSDEYYGQPLATAIKEVLNKRKRAGLGAAPAGEIYDGLVKGGFGFNTKNTENAKRTVYSALSKNTSTFHKLPNGTYGLLEWYPTAKQKKNGAAHEEDGDEDEGVSVMKSEFEDPQTFDDPKPLVPANPFD